MGGGRRALRRAVESGPGTLDSDVVSNLGNAALHLGDDETHRQYFGAMLAEARQSGAGFLVLYGLHRLAFTQLLGGDWAAVRAGAEEAVALSHAVGERGLAASPTAWLTLLAALQGTSDYDDRLAEVQEIAGAHRLGILTVPVRDLTHWAHATKAAADSDYVGALVHLRQVATPALQRMIVLDRITAAVRSDERELATFWLTEFEAFATATGWSWAGTVVNHGRALLAEGDAAAELFLRRSRIGSERAALRPGPHEPGVGRALAPHSAPQRRSPAPAGSTGPVRSARRGATRHACRAGAPGIGRDRAQAGPVDRAGPDSDGAPDGTARRGGPVEQGDRGPAAGSAPAPWRSTCATSSPRPGSARAASSPGSTSPSRARMLRAARGGAQTMRIG